MYPVETHHVWLAQTRLLSAATEDIALAEEGLNSAAGACAVRFAIRLLEGCLHRPLRRLPAPNRSAFSMALLVAYEALQLSGVDPRPLQNIANSGRTNTRWIAGTAAPGHIRGALGVRIRSRARTA